jgi:uncharacterized membrane-anchored protein YjiN (DUF445 family)
MARLRTMLAEQPAAPTLAAALRIARQNGWDRRVVQGLVNVLADAMERPEFRTTVGEVIEDLMARYRTRLGVYPRLFIGLAELIGVLDRERLVEALHSGLRQVAKDADHPLRTRASEVVAELEERLVRDPTLAGRVEAAKRELLNTPAVVTLLDDLAASLRRTLLMDLAAERSEAVTWIATRLERARQALISDAVLRVEIAGRAGGALSRPDRAVHRERRACARPRRRRPTDRGARRGRPAIHPRERHRRGRPGRGRHLRHPPAAPRPLSDSPGTRRAAARNKVESRFVLGVDSAT